MVLFNHQKLHHFGNHFSSIYIYIYRCESQTCFFWKAPLQNLNLSMTFPELHWIFQHKFRYLLVRHLLNQPSDTRWEFLLTSLKKCSFPSCYTLESWRCLRWEAIWNLPSLKTKVFAPENRQNPKRKLVFQPSIFRCELLVLGRVHFVSKKTCKKWVKLVRIFT